MSLISDQVDWASSEHYLKQEGLYIFGGKDQFNQSIGDLLILKIEGK